MVMSLQDPDFPAAVAAGVTLVDFWAPWCGPCKALAPVLEELAEEFQGRVRFAKIDSDANPDSAAAYGVMAVPTLLLFKDGRLLDRLVGARSKGRIRDFVEEGAA